jgi:hypothetical protein
MGSIMEWRPGPGVLIVGIAAQGLLALPELPSSRRVVAATSILNFLGLLGSRNTKVVRYQRVIGP